MKNKKILLISIISAVAILLATIVIFYNDIVPEEHITQPVVYTTGSNSVNEISILSFNIQIFGTSKLSNRVVISKLVDIISKYDVIAIQEVRDSSGQAVVEFMKLLDSRYNYYLGPREGRSSSKEQYWFIYDKTKLKIVDKATYPDSLNIFERRPEGVYFQNIDGLFDFVLINKHVAPGDALKEISYIPNLFDYFYSLFKDPDIIIVGDFNADGSYFDESLLAQIFPSDKFSIIIDNSFDTTVAPSSNTYDRIIISNSVLEDFTGKCGVYVFENYYNFVELAIQPKHISDHYPVWAIFYTDKDTD